MGESEPSEELTVRVRIRGRDQRPGQGKREPNSAAEAKQATNDAVEGLGATSDVLANGTPSVESRIQERPGAGQAVPGTGEAPDEAREPVDEHVIEERHVAEEEVVLVGEGETPVSASRAVLPERDTRGVVAEEGEVERGPYVPRPIPRIMAVANQKGGVGKTTTAVNLGAGLAELGYRVLVVDLDPQGNATTGLGIDARSFEHSMYDVLMRDVPLEDAVEPTSMKNLFVAPATIDLAGAEIELVPSFSRELKLRKAL